MGRREGAGGAHGAAVLRLVVPGRASTAHCSGEVGGGVTPAAVQALWYLCGRESMRGSVEVKSGFGVW